MHTFEAYVRTSGIVVKVYVQATNSIFAMAQLKGTYGENSIVHLPRQIN